MILPRMHLLASSIIVVQMLLWIAGTSMAQDYTTATSYKPQQYIYTTTYTFTGRYQTLVPISPYLYIAACGGSGGASDYSAGKRELVLCEWMSL
jgi:hypothetical protein